MAATQTFLNRLAEFGEGLFETEPFKTAIENTRQAENDERVRIVDEIAKIRKTSLKKTQEALAVRDAARAAFEEARAAYLSANNAFNKAAGAVSSLSFRTSSQIGQRERQLLETADPRIQEAIDSLEDTNKTFRTHFKSAEVPTGKWTLGGRQLMHEISNLKKVEGRDEAIRTVRRELEDLQVQAVVDVGAAIDAILAKIPDPSTLTIGAN